MHGTPMWSMEYLRMVRTVLSYESSLVRKVHCTKHPWYKSSIVQNVKGTNSPPIVQIIWGRNSLWYEKSINPVDYGIFSTIGKCCRT